MFLFSWKKIHQISDGQVGTVFLIFSMLVRNTIPKNKYDPLYKYYGKDYLGQSFLIRPELLLENAHKYTYKEIAHYIALASFRRYSEYLANKKTTLSLLESPVGKDIINQNRLLSIDEYNQIHFLYEEVT